MAKIHKDIMIEGILTPLRVEADSEEELAEEIKEAKDFAKRHKNNFEEMMKYMGPFNDMLKLNKEIRKVLGGKEL